MVCQGRESCLNRTPMAWIYLFVVVTRTFPEDTGFALKRWVKARYDNSAAENGIQIHGDIAITMGNFCLTNSEGKEIMVEKTLRSPDLATASSEMHAQIRNDYDPAPCPLQSRRFARDHGVRKAMGVSDDPRAPALSWNVVRGDFYGGVAAGVVALPLALAFGVASGIGPVAGLYGAIATGIVAAVFGGTPVQITGPTGPMTLVMAGVVATNTLPSGAVNLPGVVAIIVLAGLLQIALGLFRIGAYIRYVPYPVISGFMSGIGVIIILQQLFPMLGVEPPSSEPLAILRQLHLLGGNIKWDAVALSALTIATVFILPRFTKVVPASLVALVALSGAGGVAAA